MGRKTKNDFSKAVTITEPNIRMNFLYQASNLLAYTLSKEIKKSKGEEPKNKSIISNEKEKTIKKIPTKNNVSKKRKRVPLRVKRNKHLSELNKSLTNENNMDIDSPKRLQNEKIHSIIHKDYPLLPLARYYNTTLGVVAQKTVSRMDPNVKRSICKCCKTPLIPGLTSDIQIDDNETKYEIICKTCHTKKCFKSDNPNYSLFTERAALSTEEYTQYMSELSKDKKKGKR
ncbi:Rpr2-domain-containing protein [Piromyces finnis]|uniref:Rpr2-domain-containing protein n=1 Tax=Piromyces finnis TaxID=1754191 RepID=A0A1Y1UUL7_9FUNG|nr:Rpr2-domain-containing protein [Piromyces finnis]|eukprot:ORX41710.1 Rpr2-domain-containing protein [Piromyces finnis]